LENEGKEDNADDLNERLDLTTTQIKEAEITLTKDRKPNPDPDWCFQLIAPDKSFVIVTSSEEEASIWTYAIKVTTLRLKSRLTANEKAQEKAARNAKLTEKEKKEEEDASRIVIKRNPKNSSSAILSLIEKKNSRKRF